MDWMDEVQRRKEELLEDLGGLLRIPSTYDLSTAGPDQPMGAEVARALSYMLELSSREGFRVKNEAGYYGYAEYGPGAPDDDYIAVLCHLDVVPATGEWTSPPYEPSIRDGKLYARGAIDDKGPTLAAFYALKIVKESGLALKRNIRLIFGTNEENQCRCIEHYKVMEKKPLTGFAPDADFPIVHAEKGQINTRVVLRQIGASASANENDRSGLFLASFFAGGVPNMVPEAARARVAGPEERLEALAEEFRSYLAACGRPGQVLLEDGEASFHLEGKSAHGMEPDQGINAGLLLIHFLKDYSFQEDAQRFLACTDAYLFEDWRGRALGIASEDEITGPLTINSGIIQYEPEGESFFHINLRFPVCDDDSRILPQIEKSVGKYGFIVEPPIIKKPHHVDRLHPVIQVLQRVYRDATGEEPKLLSTGGGTYAAHIPNGIAFGPLFPGKVSLAHQPDEFIGLDDLFKSAAMYARAMYELANEDL